jgi:hypothetical protein
LAAGRNSAGGSAPSRPPNAPESSSARVPASSPLPETSTTTSSSRSRPVARRPRSRPRTGCRRPSAAPTRRTTRGQRRQHALALGSGRAGRRASTRPEAGDAEPGAPERGQQHDEREREEDADARDPGVEVAAAGDRPGQHHSPAEDDEPRQVARAEDEAAEEQRQRRRPVTGPRGEHRPRRAQQPERRRARQSSSRTRPGVAGPPDRLVMRWAEATGSSGSRAGGWDHPTGPGAEPAGTRAPEEVASLQHLGADVVPQTRQAGRCGGRRRPRPRGRRLGAGGPSPPACARGGRCRSGRCGRPRPSARRGRPTSPATGLAQACGPGAAGRSGAGRAPRRGRRCRPRPGRLVHQQVADRRSLREIRAQALSGSASGRSGSGRAARGPRRLLEADQVALGGAAQVGVRRGRPVHRVPPEPAEPDLADGRRRGATAYVELADQAEVDVDEPLAVELEEQVLAGGVGGDEQLVPSTRRRRRRTGPAGCRPDPLGPEGAVRSSASRWRVWPSGIRSVPVGGPDSADSGSGGSSRVTS